MGPRHAIAFFCAIFVTFGLLWVMQALIGVEGTLDEGARRRVIDFVRLKQESETETKKRKMPDKKPPEEPPPPPELNLAQNTRPDLDTGNVMPVFDGSLELSGGGPNIGTAAMDSDIIPLVRVEPQYPERARQRGVEGWVVVEFMISAAGTVKSPRIIAYHPSTIFNRAALQAIRKWKYNPKIEEGVAVERPGVQVRLTFEFEK